MAHGGGGGGHSHSSGHSHGGHNHGQSNQDNFFSTGPSGPRRASFRFGRGRWSGVGLIAAVVVLIIVHAVHSSSASSPNFSTVSVPANPGGFSLDGTHYYNSSGDDDLGTIKITRASSAIWLCTNCSDFSVHSTATAGTGAIASSGAKGVGNFNLAPGTYRNVQVSAPKDRTWSLIISPVSAG